MDADLLRGDKVAAALLQLAGSALAICAAAQQSLVIQLELAMAEFITASTAVIDLTTEDSNESVDFEAHGACQLSENQDDRCSCKEHDSFRATRKADQTARPKAESVQTARDLVSEAAEGKDAQSATQLLVTSSCNTLAANCHPAPQRLASHGTSHSLADPNLVGRVQQSSEASSSGRAADDMSFPSSCETNQQLMDADDLADMCMLCAYGMDLAALMPRALQSVEHWPGTCLATPEINNLFWLSKACKHFSAVPSLHCSRSKSQEVVSSPEGLWLCMSA